MFISITESHEVMHVNVIILGIGVFLVFVGFLYREDELHEPLDFTTSPFAMIFGQVIGYLVIITSLLGIISQIVTWTSKWNHRMHRSFLLISIIFTLFGSIVAWMSFTQANNTRTRLASAQVFYHQSIGHHFVAMSGFEKELEFIHKVCKMELDYVCNTMPPSEETILHLLPLKRGYNDPEYYSYYKTYRQYTNSTKYVDMAITKNVNGFRSYCSNVSEQVIAFGPAIGLAAQYKAICESCKKIYPVINQLPPWMDVVFFSNSTQSCMRLQYDFRYDISPPTIPNIGSLIEDWRQYTLMVASACTFLWFLYVILLYSTKNVNFEMTYRTVD